MRAWALPPRVQAACDWWIHRNPHYILSAMAMAVAARITLVSPDIAAGDVWNILRTFASLQAYELALFVVLFVLRRYRRGHDDLATIRIVAALFWTGPLTATTELAARDAALGSWLALSAGIFALGELAAVRRAAGLRTAPASVVVASGAIALLTVLPALLARVEAASGWRETLLYGAWCASAGLIASAAMGQTRRLGPRGAWELAWRSVVLVALLAQLFGMNYAFFARGAVFFAAPCVAALALATLHPLVRSRLSERRRLACAATLPILAIVLVYFDGTAAAAIARLPMVLRDPLSLAIGLAATIWLGIAVPLRSRVLLHFSVAAFAIFAWRIVPRAALPLPPLDAPIVVTPETSLMALALYGCAAYLLMAAWITRGRVEAVIGLLVGIVGAVQPQFEYVRFIVLLSLGWSIWPLLARLDLAGGLMAAVTVVTLLACAFDGADDVRVLARMHTLAAPLGLALFGWVLRKKPLAVAGASAGIATSGFHAARWWASGAAPPGLAVTILAYGLLTAGVFVSWRKPRRRKRPGHEAE